MKVRCCCKKAREFLLGVRERIDFFGNTHIFAEQRKCIACYSLQHRFTKTMLGKHEYSVDENIQLTTVQT